MDGGDNGWVSCSNAHHYIIDGVPMKINGAFQPKEFKDSLPSTLRYDSHRSKALKFTYAFEVEDGYMTWYDDYLADKELRRQERENRAKAAERRRVAETSPAKKSPPPPKPSTAEGGAGEARSSPRLPPVSHTLLKPERASPITVPGGTAGSSSASNYVNVKEFENLGEDPFESTELKTINVLEELKSLMGGPPPSEQSGPRVSEEPAMSGDQASAQSGKSEGKKPDAELEGVGPVVGNSSTPTLSIDTGNATNELYENFSRRKDDTSDIYENATIARRGGERPVSVIGMKTPVPAPRSCNSAPVSPGSEQPPTDLGSTLTDPIKLAVPAEPKIAQMTPNAAPKPPKPTVKPKPKTAKPNIPTTPSTVASLSSQLEGSLSRAAKPKPGKLTGFSYTQLLASANKQPDNIKNIEWPSMDSQSPSTTTVMPPSYTSPSGCASSDSSPSSAVRKKAPKSEAKQGLKPTRPPPPPPKKPSNTESSRAAELRTVTAPTTNGVDGSHAIESLVAMGFDRVQINAAVRNLGTDTGKLVEHLCSLQNMSSDKTIRWQHAQEGLFIYETDIDKAKKYAQAYQQLLEFGFEAEKIKSALISNDIDTEKALTQLVA